MRGPSPPGLPLECIVKVALTFCLICPSSQHPLLSRQPKCRVMNVPPRLSYMSRTCSCQEKDAEQGKGQVPGMVRMCGGRQRRGEEARGREGVFRPSPEDEHEGQRYRDNGLHRERLMEAVMPRCRLGVLRGPKVAAVEVLGQSQSRRLGCHGGEGLRRLRSELYKNQMHVAIDTIKLVSL